MVPYQPVAGKAVRQRRKAQVERLQKRVQAILDAQVLVGASRAVVLDVRVAADAEDVVVDALSIAPVKVRVAVLVVENRSVGNKV